MNINHPSSRRAFTLIELLVVVSIIGMLSSIVLVSLQNARTKAVNARIQQSIGQVRNALELARTSTGYPSLQSYSDGIAYYSNLPTDIKAVVSDTLAKLGTTVGAGYPGGETSPCSGGAALAVGSGTGFVITTNSTVCGTLPTEYAIYTALNPIGAAGYVCVDSKSGKASASTGGIVLNNLGNGVCSGTSSGTGSGGGTYTLTFQARVSGYTVSSAGTCMISVDGGTSVPCHGGSVTGITAGSHTISRVGTGTVGTTADTPPYFYAVQSYTPYYINLNGQTTGNINQSLTLNVSSDQLVYTVFAP